MTALEFAELARLLSAELRRLGHAAPSFRSPPRAPGLYRSLGRLSDGTVQVSVRLRERTSLAVAADMIDGALIAASLAGREASAVRDALWRTVDSLVIGGRTRTDRPPTMRVVAA